MRLKVLFSLGNLGGVKKLLQVHASPVCAFYNEYTTVPPPPPKVPKSAYLIFVNELRPQMLKDNPGVKITEVIKKIAVRWNALDAPTKTKYLERWNDDRLRYGEKYSSYLASLTSDQKVAIEKEKQEKLDKQRRKEKKNQEKKSQKPKRPGNAYTQFVRAHMGERGSYSSVDYMKVLGERWRNISEVERKQFSIKAAQEQELYAKEKLKWLERQLKVK